MKSIFALFLYGILALDIVTLAAAAAIAWGPCPQDASTLPSQYMRDCAYLDMPVNHANPTEGTISIFVRRFYAGAKPTNTGIWYNQGGPGFALNRESPIADFLVGANSAWTVYLQGISNS
jgi:hypothetical protein